MWDWLPKPTSVDLDIESSSRLYEHLCRQKHSQKRWRSLIRHTVPCLKMQGCWRHRKQNRLNLILLWAQLLLHNQIICSEPSGMLIDVCMWVFDMQTTIWSFMRSAWKELLYSWALERETIHGKVQEHWNSLTMQKNDGKVAEEDVAKEKSSNRVRVIWAKYLDELLHLGTNRLLTFWHAPQVPNFQNKKSLLFTVSLWSHESKATAVGLCCVCCTCFCLRKSLWPRITSLCM